MKMSTEAKEQFRSAWRDTESLDFVSRLERQSLDALMFDRPELREVIEDHYSDKKDLAEAFPLSHLRKVGLLGSTLRRPGKVILELFDFFNVSSIPGLEGVVNRGAVAFRQSTAHPVDDYALATWLRLVEIDLATKTDTLPEYDGEKLLGAHEQIKKLSVELPRDFGSQLVKILGECGVRLHYVPEVKGARVFGATRWIGATPVITLTLRGKNEGQFWFTLLHEIGHVVLHRDGETHISAETNGDAVSGAEQEANSYAAEFLIPAGYEEQLAAVSTNAEVRALAADLGVSPGIVVAQLWRRGHWDYSQGHKLMRSFTITSRETT